MSRFQIAAITPDYLDAYWPIVAPLLKKALDRSNGYYWIEDLYQFCKEQKMHVLVAHDEGDIVAAFTAEVIVFPRKKVLRLSHGGGAFLHDWKEALNAFMQIGAEEEGCDFIEVEGRMGWMKPMKKSFGAKLERVVMTRKV